jgi:hypothetical protein
MKVLTDIRYPLLEIFYEKVLQFACKFHTSRASADNNHVKKSLDFLIRLVFEDGGFTAVHDSATDGLGIVDFLEEESMLTNSRNSYMISKD